MVEASSPSETIAKAMEGVEHARLAIRLGGDQTAYAYTEADDDGDYMTVEDAKAIIAPLALKLEAMQREMAELRDSLSEVLELAERQWANPEELSEIRRARTLIQGEKP